VYYHLKILKIEFLNLKIPIIIHGITTTIITQIQEFIIILTNIPVITDIKEFKTMINFILHRGNLTISSLNLKV